VSLESGGQSSALGPHLPPNAVLTDHAIKELGKLDKGAAASLFETFGRRCSGKDILPREDEPLRIGKGRMLRATRTTYSRSEYRLIYFQVKPKNKPSAGATTVVLKVDRTPIRFVGVLAWAKKRTNVGGPRSATAWERTERWLDENPEYLRA
jgi:hypothetical protein